MKIAMFTNLMKSEIAFFDVTPIGNILNLLSEDAESIELAFGTAKATQFQAIVQGVFIHTKMASCFCFNLFHTNCCNCITLYYSNLF